MESLLVIAVATHAVTGLEVVVVVTEHNRTADGASCSSDVR